MKDNSFQDYMDQSNEFLLSNPRKQNNGFLPKINSDQKKPIASKHDFPLNTDECYEFESIDDDADDSKHNPPLRQPSNINTQKNNFPVNTNQSNNNNNDGFEYFDEEDQILPHEADNINKKELEVQLMDVESRIKQLQEEEQREKQQNQQQQIGGGGDEFDYEFDDDEGDVLLQSKGNQNNSNQKQTYNKPQLPPVFQQKNYYSPQEQKQDTFQQNEDDYENDPDFDYEQEEFDDPSQSKDQTKNQKLSIESDPKNQSSLHKTNNTKSLSYQQKAMTPKKELMSNNDYSNNQKSMQNQSNNKASLSQIHQQQYTPKVKGGEIINQSRFLPLKNQNYVKQNQNKQSIFDYYQFQHYFEILEPYVQIIDDTIREVESTQPQTIGQLQRQHKILKQLLTEINEKLEIIIKNKKVNYRNYSDVQREFSNIEVLEAIEGENCKTIKYFETELKYWQEKMNKCSSVTTNFELPNIIQGKQGELKKQQKETQKIKKETNYVEKQIHDMEKVLQEQASNGRTKMKDVNYQWTLMSKSNKELEAKIKQFDIQLESEETNLDEIEERLLKAYKLAEHYGISDKQLNQRSE